MVVLTCACSFLLSGGAVLWFFVPQYYFKIEMLIEDEMLILVEITVLVAEQWHCHNFLYGFCLSRFITQL